jgi:hypothetical protein
MPNVLGQNWHRLDSTEWHSDLVYELNRRHGGSCWNRLNNEVCSSKQVDAPSQATIRPFQFVFQPFETNWLGSDRIWPMFAFNSSIWRASVMSVFGRWLPLV